MVGCQPLIPAKPHPAQFPLLSISGTLRAFLFLSPQQDIAALQCGSQNEFLNKNEHVDRRENASRPGRGGDFCEGNAQKWYVPVWTRLRRSTN
jgi:hypothetical protein